MNISEDRLKQAMIDHGVTESRAQEIIEELRTPADPPSADVSPTGTRQRLLVVSDPLGRCAGVELTGWVIKVDENFPIGELPSRLRSAGVDHNVGRGRRNPVTTTGEIIDGVSATILRNRGIYRQHREPVFVTFVGRTAITAAAEAAEAAPPRPAPVPTPVPPSPAAEEPDPESTTPPVVVAEEDTMTA